MAKRHSKPTVNHSDNTTKLARTTLSALRQEADLWYRICVLLYDLSNVASDPLSENRISSTTHELYISEPYFTESEATRIRTALIDDRIKAEVVDIQSASSPDDTSVFHEELTVEEAIHNKLTDFFDKRKASGDARPCGPHDMVPIYGIIFGIQKEQLKDERFLSRLRRSGLGDSQSKEETAKGNGENSGKERKKGKKGN